MHGCKVLGGGYHADRPEGQQVVILLAVAPGVPTGVLSLLQDEHLTTEVHLFKAHKAEEEGKFFSALHEGQFGDQ